ncbi:MAG: sulfite exporter TauE/SafE family protein [Elusimicrobia bacterium]|nr:sulfite exporter TauE/SafE family protein [Elusimicrobiota bacterium]
MTEIASVIDKSPVLALWLSYGAGVLTSFTPCVYPLIPITIGIIGARSDSRLRGFILSLLYVLGMAVMYSVLGLAASFSGSIFGLTAYNPWVNLAVGAVILVFGLSMMDMLNLPLLNIIKMDPGKSGRTPFSIFIMGMISGLVVAPCSTPVLGSILSFVAVSRKVLMGGLLLFVYGFGCGTLLIAVGTFAGLTSTLPKSGTWMVTVKKIFGAVIVLAALYFFYRAFKSF